MMHCYSPRLHSAMTFGVRASATFDIQWRGAGAIGLGIVSLGTSLGTIGMAGMPGLAQTPPVRQAVTTTTTFHCVRVDNMLATIARRADRSTPPMITWQDTSFGAQYTPERRCQIVSDRLTQAVVQNGGKLTNLRLTYGPVNGFPVICYVRSREELCSPNNLLLTLRQDDRGREGQILQQILTFSVQGQGVALTRGGSSTPEPVAFGSEVERSLNSYSITPGNLPSSIGTFRQEVERSFGSGATPTLPQSSTSPQNNSSTPNSAI